MSNTITEARTEVAAALTDIGLRTFAFIPNQLEGKAAVVTPGTPYVVPGQVMGEVRVSLNVRLFCPQGTANEVVSEALDEMIVNVCAALKGYGVVTIATPGIDSTSYAKPFLVSDITITFNFSQ